jgi:23S rRNA (pseudouridine1915-N3)-methyltransferase
VARGQKAQGVRIVFCFTGKTFKGPILDLVNDYRTRISKYAPSEIIESKALKKQAREGIHILLSPTGKHLTSEALAAFIEKHLNKGTKSLFFYTGSPIGHDPLLEKQADMTLSFSSMTFNHQIVRIMLLEQVYRAFTIIHKEPYHK